MRLKGLIVYLLTAFLAAPLLDSMLVYLHAPRVYTALLLVARMWLPFLGVIAAFAATRESILEGLKRIGLRLGDLRYVAVGLTVPYLIYAVGVAVCIAMGFSPANPAEAMLEAAGRRLPGAYRLLGPQALLALLLVNAALAGLTVNAVAALGEEAGWRGYMLEELYPRYGLVPASIAIGVAWGLWHAPLIILTGYNYPHHRGPLGILAFTLLAVAWTLILAALRLLSGSLIPPAVAHGTLNALGAVMLYTFPGVDELYTIPVGLASIIASYTVALAVLIAWRKRLKLW